MLTQISMDVANMRNMLSISMRKSMRQDVDRGEMAAKFDIRSSWTTSDRVYRAGNTAAHDRFARRRYCQSWWFLRKSEREWRQSADVGETSSFRDH